MRLNENLIVDAAVQTEMSAPIMLQALLHLPPECSRLDTHTLAYVKYLTIQYVLSFHVAATLTR